MIIWRSIKNPEAVNDPFKQNPGGIFPARVFVSIPDMSDSRWVRRDTSAVFQTNVLKLYGFADIVLMKHVLIKHLIFK
ncbi:hypothetical protein HPL003_22045 [Paenibacillus terrae HPL-003]|uniref:Uncharacterized protein n=1 Tax=Paenibacillus terrae (strain HPL-003) TaxID=985665 RepID=G7VQ66_PAETH|nr:hypothetical protein HPL003_22045 [Paenibacillus terrae HPL-003]